MAMNNGTMKSSHSILPHTNLDIKTNVKEFLNEGTKTSGILWNSRFLCKVKSIQEQVDNSTIFHSRKLLE